MFIAVCILMALVVLAMALKILFGLPILGGIIPLIGRRRLALNRDGSFVDTGEALIENEIGYYYVDPITFEWLGFGLPITKVHVRLTATGEIVPPDFAVAGEAVRDQAHRDRIEAGE